MGSGIAGLLEKSDLERSDIITLLQCSDDEAPILFRKAASVRDHYLGSRVYLRGLIEYSNICSKNCLYCGVRCANTLVERYTMTRDEVLDAAMTAYRLNLGSIAIQSGENSSPAYTGIIEELVSTIRMMTDGRLGITLSLGEQSRETYERWFNAGAHRYLLRIEASSEELYRKIHPDDERHSYRRRLSCLKAIQATGYQTGTGVMIGLPWQSVENLADDIIFMRDFDIDMCGMGPYIEHADTPLGQVAGRETQSDRGSRGSAAADDGAVKGRRAHDDGAAGDGATRDNGAAGDGAERDQGSQRGGADLLRRRFNLSLRMIALMRIVMKDINIVASTAMQTIDPAGREKAIMCGANVVMPNLTPAQYREGYRIYAGKPGYREVSESDVSGLRQELIPGITIGLGEWGDTPHYARRRSGR